jgi:hypothetical membrane protein
MSDTKGSRTRKERPALTTAVKVLLACGIVSSLLYVGTDILASMIYPGYSYANQAVSELGAIGAPTRALWMAMSMLYNPLVIAFGVGVWKAAGEKRSLRLAAIFLVAYGIVSAAGPFVPMHVRGAGTSLTDVLHIACTAGMVLFMLLFVGFGANAHGKRFRIYSIATILAFVIGGTLASMGAAQIAAGAATPWFGIMERVNIYAEMLWVLMLAVTLLHATIGVGTARRVAGRSQAGPLPMSRFAAGPSAVARLASAPPHLLRATPLTVRGPVR